MAKSGYKGVSRIDSPAKKMHGWYVRVRFDNTTRAKFISDKQHGGREAALEKAVECRNELDRELGKPRTDCVIVGSNRATRRLDGRASDGEEAPRQGRENYLTEVYEVTWNAGGRRRGAPRSPSKVRRGRGLRRAGGTAGAWRRDVRRAGRGQVGRNPQQLCAA